MGFCMLSADWRLLIKKTLYHPKADEVLRAEFQEEIKQYTEANRVIVYLDESGFAHDMPRTHGYSRKGERCYGEQDWHARGRVNVIGAVQDHKLFAVRLFDCSIDSDVFSAWLTEALIPELPPQSVVVMDNATFHKRADMKEALESQGHILLFLPPYSPDLNPIEHKWNQTKAIRKQQHCSVPELFSLPSFYVESAILTHLQLSVLHL